MRTLVTTIRSIKPQIVVAYFALAAVILVIVAGAVLSGRELVRANTIPIGELRTGSLSVDAGDARAVDAEIIPAVGDVTLHGGAQKLLELDFVTNFLEDPHATYQVDGGLGDLLVEPSQLRGVPDIHRLSEYHNEWDLRLHSATPMDLEVTLGAAKGTLDFRGMALNGLAIEIGAGEALVDLRGDWTSDFATIIEGGAGRVTVLLPDEIGVRAEVHKAIGAVNLSGLQKVGDTYTNAALGKTDVALDVEIEVGIGEVNLVVLDDAAEWTEATDVEETQ